MSIPTPTYPGVTITRNAEGVPRIEAPDIFLAHEALGYMHVYDRAFQVYLAYKAARGELASVLGAGGLANDRTVKSFAYTDADFLAQYNNLSAGLRGIVEAFMRGVNARFAELIANPALRPLQFTLAGEVPQLFEPLDIIKTLYTAAVRSTAISPVQQLQNVQRLLTVRAINGVANGTNIFNDLVGVDGVTKNRWTFTEGDTCGNVGERSLQPCPTMTTGQNINAANVCNCIQEGLDNLEARNELLASYGIYFKVGSRSFVLGAQKTARNDILTHGGPQSGLTFPSPYYLANLVTPDYETDATFFVALPGPFIFANVRNGCYVYNVVPQNGSHLERDFSIEPTATTFVYNTGVIQVKGGAPVPFTTRRSGTPSAPTGWDLTVGYPNGVPGASTIGRSAYIGRDIRYLDVFYQLSVLTGIDDFIALANSPDQTDLGFVTFTFSDNQCNIGGLNSGIRSHIPASFNVNRKLPQLAAPYIGATGINNPIVPISSYVFTPSEFTLNQEPLHAFWNNAWEAFQDTNIYLQYEYSRVSWIYRILDRYGQISYQQLPEILALLGDSRIFTLGLAMVGESASNPTNVNNSTDGFFLVQERFLSILRNAPTTPARAEGLALLENYDGRWIGGDLENIVTSPNVLDEWMLANTWMAIAQNLVLAPFLGVQPSGLLLPRIVPWRGDIAAFPMFVRIVSNPCNNPIFFAGYPSGTTLETIILQAYDQAYSELQTGYGPRPWGTGLRRDVDIRSPFFASMFNPTGTVASFPYLQHGSDEYISETTKTGIIKRAHVIAPGITEQITLGPMGVQAAPSSVNLIERYQFFNLIEFGPRTVPPSCIQPVPPVPPRPGRPCGCPGGCNISDPLRRNQLCHNLNRN